MRKLWWFFLMFVSPAIAQYSAVTGFCTAGATRALLSGIKSNNTLQGVVPRCTVTVVLTGTQTPATIYSSAGGAQLDNPFTANQNGQWLFYAASVQYDVLLSGGVPPNSYVTPTKLTGLGGGGSSGGTVNPSQFVGIAGCTTAGYVYAPSVNQCIASNGTLNLKNYVLAAGGSWTGDVTTVMDAVVAASYVSASAIYVPTGSVCWSHQETIIYTLYGDDRTLSKVSVCSGTGANFTNSAPALVRLCFKTSESGSFPISTCPSNLHDIGLAGLAAFPATLTGNPSDIGTFRGTGVLIDELASNTILTNTSITNFYKGRDYNPLGGHVTSINGLSKSSFHDVYISNASGDFKFIADDFAGTQFSSIELNATSSSNVADGLVGATFIGTHMGFGPYCIHQADGVGENGLLGVTMINSSCENVGNEAWHIGQNTGGDGLRSIASVKNITSGGGFSAPGYSGQIVGQSAFPAQDYSLVLDYPIYGISFDEASSFSTGTTGFVGLIRHPQGDVLVDSQKSVLLWTGANGTVRSVHSSGVIDQNTTGNARACPQYSNNTTSGDNFQDVQTVNGCFYDSSGGMHVPLNGPSTAPTGACTANNGQWVASQDGHFSFCNGTAWATKI